MTKDWGIGVLGDQPFFIKEDLLFFKKTTLNKTVVMGRKTLEALPNSKPLKNRKNIVLSKNPVNIADVTNFSSVEDCLLYLKNLKAEEVFIIGGGSIYSQFLEYADTAFVTKIYEKYPTDVFFPNLDENRNWKIIKRSALKYEDGLYFSFCEYKNINPEKY